MEGQEIDLRGILSLLRRQFSLIALIFMLGTGATAIAILALPATYTAEALLLVDPSPKDLLDPQAAAGSHSDSARVESEVELLRSDATLLMAAERAGLVTDPEFGARLGLRESLWALFGGTATAPATGEQALQQVLAALRNAVTVQRRGLTYVIAIEAQSADPQRAALVANAVAEAHLEGRLQSKVDSILASRAVLEARISDAATAVIEAEEQFDRYIDDNVSVISEATGRIDLAALRTNVEHSTAERLRLRSAVEAAAAGVEHRDWQAVAASLQSQAVAELEARRRSFIAELEITTDGARAAELRVALEKADADLALAANAEISALHTQIAAKQAESAELRAQLRSSLLDGQLPASALTSMYRLLQTAEIARSQYQALLERSKDLEIQAYLQVADSQVVSPALAPASPSAPNPPVVLSIAAFAFLGAGLLAAFFVENVIGGFTSEAQLQAAVRSGAVTAIPRQTGVLRGPDGSEAMSLADELVLSPLSPLSESVRQLRVRIDQSIHRRNQRLGTAPKGVVVMVTSAAAHEGKTTTALALARAYALSGHRTLLIDCDLRKPEVHLQLGLEGSNGLFEFLAGNDSPEMLQSIITVDPVSTAKIVVGSRPSDVPTDQFIAGPTFGRLLQGAVENFDIVILDTPPLTPVVDGLYLAQFADVVTFVVKWASTSQSSVRKAVAALNEATRPQTELVVALSQQWEPRARARAPSPDALLVERV